MTNAGGTAPSRGIALMSKEQKEVEAKLRELAKAMLRNDSLRRKLAIRIEELLSQRMRLAESIEALRTFREKTRRNSFNASKQSPASVAKRSPNGN